MDIDPDIELDLEHLQRTLDRLRAERDRLRNEVVSLRGDKHCDWERVEQDLALAKRNRSKCKRCGRESEAPVHAYFSPCPGPSE